MPGNRLYRYHVVDVFTRQPLEGNPLAVFPDGSGLDDATMQRIARELNLSETVFVLPSREVDCAARLRIFTPAREMPFAGHPTVGASFVLLAEDIVPKSTEQFTLEEAIGPIPVRLEGADPPLIWLTTPPIHFGDMAEPSLCAEILGLDVSDLIHIPPQVVSAGNPAVFVALKDKEAVDRSWLDSSGIKALKERHPEPGFAFVFTPTADGAYSRMFAPEFGVVEDPATGSATGPLAAYMLKHGLVSGSAGTRFISEQGTKMGRRSLLHVQLNGESGSQSIEVGGYVTPLVQATMQL